MRRLQAELQYQLRYGLPVWFFSLFTGWLPDTGPTTRLRGLLVSLWLPGRPRRLRLGRDVTFLAINRLTIGSDVYIAKGCWLNAIGGLRIGDEVSLAPYVVMSSSNHGFKDGSVLRGGAHPEPIEVGFGSWVAAHAVITAGVKLGSGNLVAANSVVVRSTETNMIMAGVPAKVLAERFDNPSVITNKHDIKD